MTKDDNGEDLEDRPWLPEWAYTDDLHLAIGRVAATSALLDEALTDLVDALSGTSVFWRITDGQTTDWLLKTCTILLEDTNVGYHRYPQEHSDKFMALLRHADALRILRAQVIHGIWTTEHYLDANDKPLPWPGVDLNATYIVGRKRTRSDYLVKYMSIKDVNQLSEDLIAVRSDLVRLYRQMNKSEQLMQIPLPRWEREENDGRDPWGFRRKS